VGKLYETCQTIMRTADERGLDPFKTRGAIALRCGYLISSVHPDESDDPGKLAELKAAAEEILGVSILV
jgi:hypothetical protein